LLQIEVRHWPLRIKAGQMKFETIVRLKINVQESFNVDTKTSKRRTIPLECSISVINIFGFTEEVRSEKTNNLASTNRHQATS